MTYQTIPLVVAGPSYQSRSRPASSQKTKMFYQTLVEESDSKFILHPWFGLKYKGNAPGVDRGMHVFNEVGYRVCDQTLYSFDQNGNHTAITGSIPGVHRLIIENDGSNIIFTGPDGQFVYDGSSVSAITDLNIVGSTSVAFLNNQMIYGNPVTDLFVMADPNAPTTASGLNAARPESRPDKLVRPYAFNQNVYMFGTESTEPYWNPGVGNPPIERLDGQIMQVGLEAINSVANTDEYLYWLGDDMSIYRTTGGQRQKVSTSAISNALEGYAVASDAEAYTLTMQGINFYVINFPSENKTWALNEDLGDKGWFELSSGTNDGIYQASSCIRVYDKNFLADRTNGNLYELDKDTFLNNGELIQRQRVMTTISGKNIGMDGERVQAAGIELMMEKGEGLISGQGENPQAMLEMSYDGGNTWTQEGWARLGRLGERTLKVKFDFIKSFYTGIPRITITDPVACSIYSAKVKLKPAGW